MATTKKAPAKKATAKKAPTKQAAAKKAAAKKAPAKKSGSKTASGSMTEAARDRLSDGTFAFPDERKEPLNDARHVRNAIARFDQVEDVSDAERDKAWKRIKTAAKKYGVDVEAKSWRDLAKGGKPKR